MRNPFRNPTEAETRWQLKQRAAYPGRYYGDGGTIHGTNYLHVETWRGVVVAVWFRCQLLPFKQVEVDDGRADDMSGLDNLPLLTGVEVFDLEGNNERTL